MPPSNNNPTAYDIRRYEQEAFEQVIRAYADISSVLGQRKSVDYEKIAQGAGPKYGFNDAEFRLIDFTIDVIKTAELKLTTEEFLQFKAFLVKLDYSIPSRDLQAKLGRVFIDFNLFPVKYYLTAIKKTRPK